MVSMLVYGVMLILGVEIGLGSGLRKFSESAKEINPEFQLVVDLM